MGFIFKTKIKNKIKIKKFEKLNLKLDSQIHLCWNLELKFSTFRKIDLCDN